MLRFPVAPILVGSSLEPKHTLVNGRSHLVEVTPDTTVHELREKIAIACEFPYKDQRLVYKGNHLASGSLSSNKVSRKLDMLA